MLRSIFVNAIGLYTHLKKLTTFVSYLFGKIYDIYDTECRGILKFQRMCFGDICASAVLLLSYANFVLPTLTSPLARKVLSALYVDDSLSGNRDKNDLEEAVNQVIEKLAIYGFFPKFVYFN